MAIAEKSQLRKEFLAARNAIDSAVRTKHSAMIRQRLFGHATWRAAEYVLCYVSFGSEVETHTILQEALRFKKRVVVPIHDSTHATLLSEIKRFGELGAAHRGVLQVQTEFIKLVDPVKIDLALLPGLAFDKKGGRLGFGGGYFDKLLPQMVKAKRVALAYDSQISANALPLENHDMLMDLVISEKAILDTGRGK